MKFSRYTNTDRGDGTFSIDPETKKKVENKERYYSPALDTLGPANWIPLQCYSSVDFKYTSSVIGIIKNGNQLEEDLWT